MHIAVAGNIGAGKTTLTGLLAKNFGWKPQYEAVDMNPYLDDFYNDMEKWAFNLQIYFLGSRFKQIIEIRESGEDIIQDRTIHEDAFIFASNLHDMGLLMSRDYENYLSVFNLMNSFVQAPDLLIYLRASIPTLVKQIHLRGREYETGISIDYLSRLNDKYEEWVEKYDEGKMLVIEVDNLDIVHNPEDLGFVYDKVDAEINGLF